MQRRVLGLTVSYAVLGRRCALDVLLCWPVARAGFQFPDLRRLQGLSGYWPTTMSSAVMPQIASAAVRRLSSRSRSSASSRQESSAISPIEITKKATSSFISSNSPLWRSQAAAGTINYLSDELPQRSEEGSGSLFKDQRDRCCTRGSSATHALKGAGGAISVHSAPVGSTSLSTPVKLCPVKIGCRWAIRRRSDGLRVPSQG